MIRKITFLMVSLFMVVIVQISYTAVTGKAKGTPVKSPDKGKVVQAASCFGGCHETVKMLYELGAHSKANCGMCHEVPPEHLASPDEGNRPLVRTVHRSCAACHEKQLENMLDMSFHISWAAKNEIPTYNTFSNSQANYFQLVQSRTPRKA